MTGRRLVPVAMLAAAILATGGVAGAQSPLSGPPMAIRRAPGAIKIDGDLSDEGWRGAERVETWFEISPGDNVVPKVGSVGLVTYDDRFFYAAFDFTDPNPAAIRAPLGDHDGISGSYTDFGGVFLDTRNDGRSAVVLFATPRGVQYDAISDDASGEDSSPDFFWDAAAHVNDHGWTLELRVPFSSLRYRSTDPQSWGIMLFRNYPRDFRYQLLSTRVPRGGNCFICRAGTLVGLDGLPRGGHLVVAPYVSATETALPAGELGTPLVNGAAKPHGGADLKWTPNADNAVDLTVKPDFSQVEADTPQISANERFALFFPEKRPFFLEGVNLLKTPIQAVYTRTISAPRWGGRVTGKIGGFGYTALVSDDTAGGGVVVPGPLESSVATQDFGATAFIGRVKREIGQSFVSVLATDRESQKGNGYNRVVGPDFEWRPSVGDVVSGEFLVSDTRTPTRPDLADEWTGQSFTSQNSRLQWNHNTTHFDSSVVYSDVGGGFRANLGFVPQVGVREESGSTGWTVRPSRGIRRLRTFLNLQRQTDRDGGLIVRSVQPGAGMDTKWGGFLQFRSINETYRTGGSLIDRRQFGYVAQFSPSRRVAQLALNGTIGSDVDFANSRPGHGGTVNVSATFNPTDHVSVALVDDHRWVDVAGGAGANARLVTARVSRISGTYTFTARMFVRVIGQYTSTDRNTALYVDPSVTPRETTCSGSALFAYKLDWQSVLFVGYGDDRDLSDQNRLVRADRQVFVKVSYAIRL